MKKVIYFIICLILFTGCGSSKKMYQKGRYDQAINKAVKKLRKNPTKVNDINILDRSYNIANERDNERVRYLEMEGNPNSWDEILGIYSALKNRQSLVRTVLPLKLPNRTINYQYVDYDQEIISAKQNAAEFYFANAQELMKNGDKESYRQAYHELQRAKNYAGGGYLGIDQLIAEAREKGISRALFTINNQTIYKLSREFEESILSFNISELNSEWVEYHTRQLDENITYDYIIDVILKVIEITPERISESLTTEKKDIRDGFEYELDNKGNVKKDSLGNDIKKPKYKTISCEITKSLQQKSVHVVGLIEMNSLEPKKTLKKEEIGADGFFEHVYGKANGDMNALTAESIKLVENLPLPFPHDLDMIYRAGESLKNSIRNVVFLNRRFIQ